MEGNDGMTGGADYEFEWDDAKAETNLSKHGVAFMDAMSVLLDPLAMTRFDDEHSDDEERWVSLVSARPATRREIEQYEQG